MAGPVAKYRTFKVQIMLGIMVPIIASALLAVLAYFLFVNITRNKFRLSFSMLCHNCLDRVFNLSLCSVNQMLHAELGLRRERGQKILYNSQWLISS